MGLTFLYRNLQFDTHSMNFTRILLQEKHGITNLPAHANLVHESLARRVRGWGVARARDTVTGVSGSCDPVRGAERCTARGH